VSTTAITDVDVSAPPPCLHTSTSPLVRHRRIRSRTMCIVNEEIEIENRERMEASRLDTDAGLAPMSSLGVVSVMLY
jgi:hypothetical protein